jgi:hypothetical protein
LSVCVFLFLSVDRCLLFLLASWQTKLIRFWSTHPMMARRIEWVGAFKSPIYTAHKTKRTIMFVYPLIYESTMIITSIYSSNVHIGTSQMWSKRAIMFVYPLIYESRMIITNSII